MNFISEPMTELMEVNYGSMMEQILQVWLMIFKLGLAVIPGYLTVLNNGIPISQPTTELRIRIVEVFQHTTRIPMPKSNYKSYLTDKY